MLIGEITNPFDYDPEGIFTGRNREQADPLHLPSDDSILDSRNLCHQLGQVISTKDSRCTRKKLADVDLMFELPSSVFLTKERHEGGLCRMTSNSFIIEHVVTIFGANIAGVVRQDCGGHQDIPDLLSVSVHSEGHTQLNECRRVSSLLAKNTSRSRAAVAQRPHIATYRIDEEISDLANR